ncbi:MAG: hypothetical protein B7Y86_10425 [Brevundimonas subvibrioides]|uniref:Uncharacterized protein n=1 Tax=Brevundimonas subvibrioides TaxID=74313 RepID=A0A258HH95_9CAUL|nr:hypothetical protein [Brevundimonas subvibrioides]OYX56351.1 MAG: hypothetical protein B7Y86_10425 [Brevundimonas subvibrioides]
MKKQTLLGAIALTTIAIGAAGAANAQQYTVTVSADADLTAATVKAATKLATELKLDATNTKGVLGLAVVPSVGAILPGGNSLLTFSLTGGTTFGTNVTPGAIVLNTGGCNPTTTISSGGLAASSSVTFLLSGLGLCNNGSPIIAQLPVQLPLTGTNSLSVDTQFKTELGTAIDGGSASLAAPAVTFAQAFKATTAADTAATAATLANGFKSLTEPLLGTVTLAVTAATVSGIDAVGIADAAVIGDVTKADFKFVGTQSATAAQLTLAEGVNPAADVAVTGLISDASPTAVAYTVGTKANGAAISASTYTVQTDLTLAAPYVASATFGPSSLQSITREGTTYLIPWVSSGTLANSTGNATVVRIANIGTATSGAVSAELLTSSTGTPASTSLVALSSGITKGGELVITGASLETSFGANFGRGDVRITAEAQPATLITRRFIQNVANGSLTEVSLGRDATGSEPQN